MATKIVTKNSSTASAVPTASDLVQGELAVNVADKRLFTEDNAGAIVELGTNPSTLTVTGEITANGGIALGDNDKATFGASDDLEIYHDGTNNRLTFVSANTYIQTDGTIHFTDIGNSEKHFTINDNGAVDLYYDNSKKLATTATGIDVTGTATMDALTVGDTSVGQSLVQMLANPTNGANTIHFGDSTSGAASYVGYINYAHDSNSMQFAAGGAERMRIDSSGNVGIGTTTPSNDFHVSSTSGTKALFEKTGSTGAYIGLKDSSGSLVYLGDNNGTFEVQTAGSSYSTKLAVTSAGNVGIGTSSISGRLEIKKATASNETLFGIEASGVTTTTLGSITYDQSDDSMRLLNNSDFGGTTLRLGTRGNDNLVIDYSGNVGIGTSSVDTKLHLEESDTTSVFLKTQNSAGALLVGNNSSGNSYVSAQTSGKPLILETENTERMRIDSSGNVGIGTSSPSDKLHVGASSGGTQLKIQSGSGVNNCVLHTNGTTDSWRTGMNLALTNGSYEFYDDVNNVDRMVIDSSGNVGIGTSSITSVSGYTSLEINNAVNGSILDLSQGDSMRGRFIATASSMALETSGSIPIVFQPAGIEAMRIDSSGNLLVGTTTLQGRITVTATGSTTIDCARTETSTANNIVLRNGNGAVGSIQTSGSSTSYNTSSDQRLKENIADADDAGSKIDAIQVRQYDWKADGSHQDYGMIAQELLEVAPEAVSQGETEEEMMGVDYSKLVPMLVKEIQSLRNRVAQLEE